MSDAIQQLDDAQLDGIVGGMDMKALQPFVGEKGGVRVFTQTEHSSGSMTVSVADLGKYLSRLQSRGVTSIGLYRSGSDKVEMHSLAEVQGWCR
ncbi:hypothetical protein [uncultured Desulfovibrio sp.]|uniref:hypothetical protein n=1 Tax=uncultured Desulfovibrio sp. TaxID=167968 RepID=UPI00262C4007|nr:hypothetical protein [uncultured Desulfovibrio sp.]